MKKKEEKIKKEKKNVFAKVMATFLLVAMVLASCSTCISYVYYVISNG